MRKLIFAVLLSLIAAPAAAGPIYLSGNTCPSSPLDPGLTRQYQVIPSLACVYDVSSNNLQGTTAEAATYLEGVSPWGTGWVGLGQNPSGFSFTADAENDNGTFSINPALAGNYTQYALAIKDGAIPFWSIFLLPSNTFSGDWNFLTNGGSLSHFALYGHDTGFPPPPPPPPPPPAAVPEPTSLLLLGSGLVLVARRLMTRKT